MQQFGKVDHHAPQEADLSDWPCPISTDQAELIIATAANHCYLAELHESGSTGGFIVDCQISMNKAVKEARRVSHTCAIVQHTDVSK